MMGRFWLVFAIWLVAAAAVERNKFKTCDEASFCSRLRAFKPEASPYHVVADSVKVHEDMLIADVINTDYKKAKFELQITAQLDSTFRVVIDESTPLYPRYRTQLALDGEPIGDTLKLVENKEGRAIVANSQGQRAVVQFSPLKVDFLDLKGDVAVSLNELGQMVVEHLRQKAADEENAEDSENAVENKNEDEKGMWEENFKGHHDSKPRGPEAIALDVTFPDAVKVYGIPQHTDTLALQTTTSGEPYRLYNLDVFEYELDSRMAIYGAVPVMYSHGPERSAGVFWHNPSETWVEVENSADGNVVSSLVNLVTGAAPQKRRISARWMSESGVVDLFVFLGPKPADLMRQYSRLTGVTPLPPKFSLGYHQCRWNYVDEDDVRSVDENFDIHDIPADTIWLDIEYTDSKKYFTWDPIKFSRPAEMIANLTAKGRRLVVIIDPHIKREAGYFLHEDAQENGYYVKNKDGGDYEGWCWPGSSGYLDFFNPAVSDYYASLYSFERFVGTTKDVHLWNDMNEPSVFNGPEITMLKDCRHYKPAQEGVDGIASFWEHRHIHNEYGLSQIRATFAGMLQRSPVKYRPFILTRSTFAGTQRYAAVWTGDNMAEWPFLKASVRMCLSLAISGINFCGSDVGGFFKYPQAELMTRWYQAGAFQPFFRAHSHLDTKRREPWLYEPSTTKLLREAVRRRYALIDFWYTLFYEHSIDGLPIMRPMFVQFPDDERSYTLEDQYMLGDILLVCPVLDEGATSVEAYLPPGEVWYDADTYRRAESGRKAVDISKIPVYQRGGTIVAKKERVRRSSALMADDPYTLVMALSSNRTAKGSLYIDDGETYEYRNKNYVYAKIEYTSQGISYTFPNPKASYPTRSWLERVVIAGVNEPPRSAKLIQSDKQTNLQMTYHKGNDVLVIRKPGASMASPWHIVFN